MPGKPVTGRVFFEQVIRDNLGASAPGLSCRCALPVGQARAPGRRSRRAPGDRRAPAAGRQSRGGAALARDAHQCHARQPKLVKDGAQRRILKCRREVSGGRSRSDRPVPTRSYRTTVRPAARPSTKPRSGSKCQSSTTLETHHAAAPPPGRSPPRHTRSAAHPAAAQSRWSASSAHSNRPNAVGAITAVRPHRRVPPGLRLARKHTEQPLRCRRGGKPFGRFKRPDRRFSRAGLRMVRPHLG